MIFQRINPLTLQRSIESTSPPLVLDVPLCYCFDLTRRSVADEIAGTGQSSAVAAITELIKAGQCACDVKNPSGQCCLGDVRRYEKEAAEQTPRRDCAA